MRQVVGRKLWIGSAHELHDMPTVMASGIEAVIELSARETLAALPREIVRCRYPLCDGEENPEWLLRLAVETVAALLRAEIPLFICCSAGMSRSVVVAAGGVALAEGKTLADSLHAVVAAGPADVSPALLLKLKQAMTVTA